jgi:uncharacterized membrane protein
MMPNPSHLEDVSSRPAADPVVSGVLGDDPAARVWVSRLTGIVGAIMLVIALLEWFARHGHYRLVLALFIVAMFCAILHSYVFEDPQR